MSSITTTSVSTATASVQNQMQAAAPPVTGGSPGNAAMNVSDLVSSLVSALPIAHATPLPPVVDSLPGSVCGDATSA